MKISSFLFALSLAGTSQAAPIALPPDRTSRAPHVRDTRHHPFRVVRVELPKLPREITRTPFQPELDGNVRRPSGGTSGNAQIPSSRDADASLQVPVSHPPRPKTPIVAADGHPETLNSGAQLAPVWSCVQHHTIYFSPVLEPTPTPALFFLLSSLLLVVVVVVVVAARLLAEWPSSREEPTVSQNGQHFGEKDWLCDRDELSSSRRQPTAGGDSDDSQALLVFCDNTS